MTYYSNVMDNIIEICSDPTVAVAASVPSTSWNISGGLPHIFVGDDLTSNFNLGRLPVLLINRASNSYEQINPQTDGGQIDTEIVITIIVKKPRKQESQAEELIWNIWNAIWSLVKNDIDYSVANFQVGDAIKTFSDYRISFTIIVSHSH